MDQRRRHRLWTLTRTALLGASLTFLALGRSPGCTFGSRHDAFSNEGLKSGDASAFTRTLVTPHLEQSLAPGKNVLWCATFQLAWNEACALIGEDIHLLDEPPMVGVLNQKRVAKEQIDDASCVALAGWIRDGILGRIDRELARKFHGAATPRLVHAAGPLRPQDIVAYAYLYKDLEFPRPFERLDDPLAFAGARVASFGIGPYKAAQRPMYEQVTILDYQNPDDFVIELRTKSPGDQVILAKIPPAPTLAATVERVLSVVRRQPAADQLGAFGPSMMPGDRLQVPKLNFDIQRRFDEIELHKLLTANSKVAPDLWVLLARQDTRFQMNETGVKLRSEANLTFGCSATVEPSPTHLLIFDKPFLLMLKRKDADQPYFALWVENAELLVPA